MRLFVILHGGCNYAPTNMATEYPSLAAVQREYERRDRDPFFPCWGAPGAGDLDNGGRQYVATAWLVPDNVGDPETDIILLEDEYGRPTIDTTDMYPEQQLTKGPRGGFRWEHC